MKDLSAEAGSLRYMIKPDKGYCLIYRSDAPYWQGFQVTSPVKCS